MIISNIFNDVTGLSFAGHPVPTVQQRVDQVYDPVVTFDEVVATHYQVGLSIAHELRCTGLGGLSITKSAKAIEAKLISFKSC